MLVFFSKIIITINYVDLFFWIVIIKLEGGSDEDLKIFDQESDTATNNYLKSKYQVIRLAIFVYLKFLNLNFNY